MSRRGRPKSLRGERGARKRFRLAERDGSGCFYCRHPFVDLADATFDHFIPCSLWWNNRSQNLVLACRPCNQAKGDSLPLTLCFILLQTFGRQAVKGATS